MTISDPLNHSKFAADVQDILISDAEQSVAFELLKGGRTILSETYNYDADNQIRITGLAQVIAQSLYGELATGTQDHADDTFEFRFNNETKFRKSICAMRLQNPRDPDGIKEVLAAGADGVCYPGEPLLVTVIDTKLVRLNAPGRVIATTHIGSSGTVSTIDCDPAKLFPSAYDRGTYINIGNDDGKADDIERRLLPPCSDLVTVRFLNRYDMPESLTARYMTEKPTTQDDVSVMYGRRVRFGVKSSTEYTLASGRMRFDDQFDTWQDLLTSRKAQIRWQGKWIDIIITKSNYTRQRRQFHSSQVEIAFQTANPYMTL